MAADERVQREKAEEARKEAEQQQREQARKGLEAQIGAAAREAVDSYARLPGWLKSAQDSRGEAERHFANGAFSPFWQSIEASYQDIGEYLKVVDRISTLSTQYVQQVRSYRQSYGSSASFPPFPVNKDDVKLTRVASDFEQNLGKVVYEAQREPTFAMIWEQRRNTAVLIMGFQTLGQAIGGMRAELARGFGSLQSAIEQSPAAVSASVSGLSSSVSQLSSSTSRASDAMMSQTRELTAKVSKANDSLGKIASLESRAQGYPLAP